MPTLQPPRSASPMLRSMLLLLIGLALAPSGCFASPQVLLPTTFGPGFATYNLEVSLSRTAPDCFERTTVLINGMKSPTMIVQQGTMINVTVSNRIPEDFPSVYPGISIHWHGLPMYGEASWYDGVAYADQCPIGFGKSFTYSFVVDTPPGTYFWHDHAFAWKGDGLQGAFIVTAPAGSTEPWQYDAEHVLLLSDWWHTESNVLAMRLNRPFDAARVTNNSGAWSWVGLPQALLINDKGYYGDCQLNPGNGNAPGPIPCNASVFTVPPGRSAVQPWASDTNPGCTHERIIVQPGLTYRMRLIAGSELTYFTVCFEGHTVTVIAADAIPVDPFQVTCLDINVAQRYDVLLTADQAPRDYWISVHAQYRTGTPSGYAVLSYNANASSTSFPPTPTPQPGLIPPWNYSQIMQVKINPNLLVAQPPSSPWAPYLEPDHNLTTRRVPPGEPTRRIRLASSQPVLNSTGILRWAINDVTTPTTPVCEAYRTNIQRNPNWLNQYLGNGRGNNQSGLQVPSGTSSAIRAFEYGRSTPLVYPTIGLQVVSIEAGEVIDVVIQNQPANSGNGDYRVPDGASRTAMEQHPFHLHGHHFWVLGIGRGVFDPNNATQSAMLNLVNPVMRDTALLPNDGWTVIRFIANNPGAWPLHCHILWHHFMGQQLHFLESRSQWTPQPRGFPKCPQKCVFNMNPYAKDWVQNKWGYTGYPLP